MKEDPEGIKYCDALQAMIPDSITMIDVFYNPEHINNHIMEKISQFAKKKNICLANYETKEIHDRVWIKDKSRGWVVGTSFNGLGNKLAFLLDLPHDDLVKFLDELDRIRSRVVI